MSTVLHLLVYPQLIVFPQHETLACVFESVLCAITCTHTQHMHTHTQHMHTHMHTCTKTQTHTITHKCTHCVRACVYACVHVCVCVCACVYACVYEHAHFAWSNKRLDKKHTSRPYLFSLTSSSTPPHKYQVTTTLFFRSHLLPNACMAI